jgi:hypothetical protein
MERGRFFMVQRTTTFEAVAGRMQGGIIKDNVFDIHLHSD